MFLDDSRPLTVHRTSESSHSGPLGLGSGVRVRCENRPGQGDSSSVQRLKRERVSSSITFLVCFITFLVCFITFNPENFPISYHRDTLRLDKTMMCDSLDTICVTLFIRIH